MNTQDKNGGYDGGDYGKHSYSDRGQLGCTNERRLKGRSDEERYDDGDADKVRGHMLSSSA